MQWSKRKKRVESFFADSVKGRIELRATHYRATHDQQGRGYITFDKNEVWSMCTLSFYSDEYERIYKLVSDEVTPYKAQLLVHEQLKSEGRLSQYLYYESLDEYCNNTIEESLTSPNLLIRCLAMLDSRLGQRRILTIDLDEESQMVVKFYKIRRACDNTI